MFWPSTNVLRSTSPGFPKDANLTVADDGRINQQHADRLRGALALRSRLHYWSLNAFARRVKRPVAPAALVLLHVAVAANVGTLLINGVFLRFRLAYAALLGMLDVA